MKFTSDNKERTLDWLVLQGQSRTPTPAACRLDDPAGPALLPARTWGVTL